MLVREVPFDSQTLILGACSILMLSCSVCFAVAMIWDDKKWSEVLMEKVCIRFILPLGLVFIAGVMVTDTALSSSPRPVAEGDYEKLGSYTATVARVYPQSQLVEVETDFGVSLPVPASMMPEGADVVGATVDVDVSKLEATEHLSLLPNRDRGAAGEGGPIFVYDADCASSGVLTCSQALGDDGEHWYAVTSVRTS